MIEVELFPFSSERLGFVGDVSTEGYDGVLPGGIIVGVDLMEKVLVGGALVKGSVTVVLVAIVKRHELELCTLYRQS